MSHPHIFLPCYSLSLDLPHTDDAPSRLSEAGQGWTSTDAGQQWHMNWPKEASEQGEHIPVTCPQGSAQPGTGQEYQVPCTNAMSPNTTVGTRSLCAALCSAKAQPCPLQGALG